MSISGVLEDLPLADVLQFIHLGQRTGTLYLWRTNDRRAEIGFHQGRIITAWTPDQDRLGDLLLNDGKLDPEELQAALRYQKAEGNHLALGQILLDRQSVTREQIYDVLRDQIQATVFELVMWRKGRFQFEVDELHPMDDLALTPAELLDNLHLNTQMLVLEAARRIDERRRAGVTADEDDPPTQTDLQRIGWQGAQMPTSITSTSASPPPRERRNGRRHPDAGAVPDDQRCQMASADVELLHGLSSVLGAGMRLVRVPLREAGTRLPGEFLAPIVLLDLRDHQSKEIAGLARTGPGAPVIAITDDAEIAAAAWDAGAVAVAAPEAEALAACCRNLTRMRGQSHGPTGSLRSPQSGLRRFRSAVFEAQAGFVSATMALNLMLVISESVERAVLFLIQRDSLAAFGAFGFSNEGRPLAEATCGLRLQVDEDSLLELAIDAGKAQEVHFDDPQMPRDLAQLVGRPASNQVVAFPVLGAEATIAVIYTDNGAKEEEIRDIRLLELATSQVGVALENELLSQTMQPEIDAADMAEMLDGEMLDGV